MRKLASAPPQSSSCFEAPFTSAPADWTDPSDERHHGQTGYGQRDHCGDC